MVLVHAEAHNGVIISDFAFPDEVLKGFKKPGFLIVERRTVMIFQELGQLAFSEIHLILVPVISALRIR